MSFLLRIFLYCFLDKFSAAVASCSIAAATSLWASAESVAAFTPTCSASLCCCVAGAASSISVLYFSMAALRVSIPSVADIDPLDIDSNALAYAPLTDSDEKIVSWYSVAAAQKAWTAIINLFGSTAWVASNAASCSAFHSCSLAINSLSASTALIVGESPLIASIK